MGIAGLADIIPLMKTNSRLYGGPFPGPCSSRGGWCLVLLLLACGSGCRSATTTPRVIYLDGAGWFGSAGSVKAGLRAGGYAGAFETFTWTSFLGAPADHLLTTRSTLAARRLARRIARIRRDDPEGPIYLMGLSAGTAVVLKGLEELPEDVSVDYVVLFSSSVSARRDLSRALEHVGGRLYATCSPHDRLLASLAINADGSAGASAGRRGFTRPPGLDAQGRRLYAKVVNLPWKPSYTGFGWNGGHLRATSRAFVAAVVAPRILSAEPFPLDRPVVVDPWPG